MAVFFIIVGRKQPREKLGMFVVLENDGIEFGCITRSISLGHPDLKVPEQSYKLCVAFESHIEIRGIENVECLGQVIEINENSKR